MMDIPMEVHRYYTDRGRRADISIAKQLERSIQRNGLVRQQLQNLIMDMNYHNGDDDRGRTFVEKELNRILLET